jgi:formylglycine-generating enzyme required for sulfatase activity
MCPVAEFRFEGVPSTEECGNSWSGSIRSIVLSLATAARAVAALRPGRRFRDCADCPEMVVIPAGSITMGSLASEPGRYDEEGRQRRVSIHQFAVAKFDVTRGQWAALASATNRSTRAVCAWSGRSVSKPDPTASWRNLGFLQDDNILSPA